MFELPCPGGADQPKRAGSTEAQNLSPTFSSVSLSSCFALRSLSIPNCCQRCETFVESVLRSSSGRVIWWYRIVPFSTSRQKIPSQCADRLVTGHFALVNTRDAYHIFRLRLKLKERIASHSNTHGGGGGFLPIFTIALPHPRSAPSGSAGDAKKPCAVRKIIWRIGSLQGSNIDIGAILHSSLGSVALPVRGASKLPPPPTPDTTGIIPVL